MITIIIKVKIQNATLVLRNVIYIYIKLLPNLASNAYIYCRFTKYE